MLTLRTGLLACLLSYLCFSQIRAALKRQQGTNKSLVKILAQVFLKLCGLLLILYGMLMLVPYLMQTKMIFPASEDVYRNPSQFSWTYEEVLLPVAGEQTMGWYVPLENARGVVLFSHGNAGNIADRLESIRLLRSLGLSVLVYDYGGYGQSTGACSEQRCYADIRAMWEWLTKEQGVPPEQILLFGRSLGGAVAADLACEVKAGAVVLESTFLSTVDMARELFPWLPVNLLLKHRFMSKDKIARIESPLLYIHSPEDDIIPYHHGVALFELATKPKQFLEIQGDHNTGFMMYDAIYRQGWEAFLAPIMPRPDNDTQ